MPYFNVNEKDIELRIIDEEEAREKLIEIVVNINYLKKKIEELKNLTKREISNEVEMTEREIEVLKNISKGRDNKAIAKEMNISVHTVKVHIHNIFTKLSSSDRTEAVIKAIKANLIEL